ncbi:MAG: putative sulfate exporter family transporter [Sphingomonadales bacterium]|nr:putative sulfate exporter family transporter [Sphingomonadales bacterium]MBD3772663.1 putative sulfate exporter family transporter [Paracoccaceae bacterium]
MSTSPAATPPETSTKAAASKGVVAHYYPGVLIAVVGGICSEAISQHYGAPAMLIALLIGLALHFIYDLPKIQPGINYTARSVLRYGVALLGIKIAVADMIAVGIAPLALVAGAMVMTMITAVVVGRMLGLSKEFCAVSGGSVAVCGASAAAAVASVLPQNEEAERDLAVTIAVVTLMATIAMIFYPLMVKPLGLTPQDMGVILGGTIHDVAQVVAAGNAISPKVGELATFVKLVRVALLLPIVMGVFIWLGKAHAEANRAQGQKVSYIPGFLVAFFVLAAINSFVFPQFPGAAWPKMVSDWGSTISHYFLVIAITAIGIKTNLKSVLDVGWRPFALIVIETLVMLAVVMGGVLLMK